MLSAKNLNFERHFKPVFHPLDFHLDAGGLLLISGANGCGKTTLIRLLAGVLHPTSGKVESTAQRISYVGHLLGIKDDLSVEENLRFMKRFLNFNQGADNTPVFDLVGRLGLGRVARQLTRTLSAGQRKRCALARLLMGAYDLWLLDEPYSNLDDQGISLVDQMLQEHLDRGGACALTTHGTHRPPVSNLQEIRMLSGVASA